MSTPIFKKLKKTSLRPTSSSSIRDTISTPENDVSPLSRSTESIANASVSSDRPNGKDGQEEDDGDFSPSAAIAAAKARTKKEKKKRPVERLSFGGEEDESSSTTFVPKKSALSRALQLPRPPISSDLTLSQQTPASAIPSSYSSSYLSELKASTPTRPGPLPPSAGDRDGGEYDAITRAKYNITADEGGVPIIPTQSAIDAAKNRRSKLRSTGGDNQDQDGFISIREGGRKGALVIRDEEVDLGRTGLMREDDELGDGADEFAEFTEANVRIPLGKAANKKAARLLKGEKQQLIEEREEEDEEESDGEGMEWEDAQIRRANLWAESEDQQDASKTPYRAAHIPTPVPLPSLSNASARLSEALSTLTMSHAEHTARLESAAAELTALDHQENDLRREVERVEEKREWAEEFKGWVEEVGKFLEVKYPEMEKIEKENIELLTERYRMISLRRLEDDSDDLCLCLGTPLENLSSLGPKLSASISSSTPNTLDLISPPMSDIRTQRRETRQARLASSTSAPSSLETTPFVSSSDQGYLTDSTLPPSEESDYALARAGLDERRRQVLGDVSAVDLRDPELGLVRRFKIWRERDGGEEYLKAWGGEALVTAWEFWARLDLSGWDPLTSSETLDHFPFYTSLHHYSRPPIPHDEDDDDLMEDEKPPLGPEGDLVASILKNTVLPRLTKVFESGGAFDPYSGVQTRRAVDLVELLEEGVGKDSARFQTFVKALLTSFNSLLETLSSLTMACRQGSPPPAFNPLSFSSRTRFLSRVLKVIKNALAFHSYEPSQVGRLVEGLVEVGRMVAELGWEEEGGGREWGAKVRSLVPGGLLNIDLERRLASGPPQGW
ncbi:Transcriptional regulators binding to the GC-rich sequences [Phaffia rhodozyma]|uniref:Transcriptional regulators binding to the GC-rich sequences n=1 Tax=Phaffia rhodozyma TaxID=264483 RepID=A0A0F7SGU3_PHARH|nr:Transcriptional regulators binding to the GC-rich sequences [Phaffia rhodozyma]